MKYLSLYEAFESEVLSKTLKYVKGRRLNFLEDLKYICNKIDFPFSKLSDDFFEYLPFKKALEKNISVSDATCDSSSIELFFGAGLGGEYCKEGKIKRRWGSGTRIVTCPLCKGSGIRGVFDSNSKVKLVKFWFTSSGDYLFMSGVNGFYNKKDSDFKDLKINEIEKFNSVSSIKNNLKHGDYVLARIGDDRSKKTLAFVYKDTENIYFLTRSSSCNGSEPWDGINWRSIDTVFGKPKYSWVVNSIGDFTGEVSLVSFSKNTDDEVDSIDPYDYNFLLNYDLDIIENSNLVEKLKSANFAIILDFGKMSKSDYKKTSDIRTDRKKSKESAFLTPEEIRRVNINKYLDKLKNVDVSEISNINLMIKRIFGFNKNFYFFILNHGKDVIDTISEIRYAYTKMLLSDDSDNIQYYTGYLTEYYKNGARDSFKKSSTLNNVYPKVVLKCGEDAKELFSLIESISEILFNKINNFKFETIEDFDILIGKLKFLSDITYNKMGYDFRNFINYLSSGDVERSLAYLPDIEDGVRNLKSLEKIYQKY